MKRGRFATIPSFMFLSSFSLIIQYLTIILYYKLENFAIVYGKIKEELRLILL